MKYLLLLTLLFSFSSPAFSQEKEILKRIDSIGAKLEIAAAKLGVASEHMWGVLVKESVIQGVVGLVHSICGLLFFGFCLIKLFRKRHFDEYESITYNGVGFIMSVVLTLFYLLFFIMTLSGNIGRIFNPEYYAAMEVVELFK